MQPWNAPADRVSMHVQVLSGNVSKYLQKDACSRPATAQGMIMGHEELVLGSSSCADPALIPVSGLTAQQKSCAPVLTRNAGSQWSLLCEKNGSVDNQN